MLVLFLLMVLMILLPALSVSMMSRTPIVVEEEEDFV
jgi:hypothetical protein